MTVLFRIFYFVDLQIESYGFGRLATFKEVAEPQLKHQANSVEPAKTRPD
jgi:hypothetical protein